MKFFLLDVSIAMAGILMLVQSLPAQESQPEKPKQFIYVLRLVSRLHADANWTEEDKKALQRDFVRFQEAIKTGQLDPGRAHIGIGRQDVRHSNIPGERRSRGPEVHGRRSNGRWRFDDSGAAPVHSCAGAQKSLNT